MSDDDTEEGNLLLGHIKHLEYLVQDLKRMVITSGDNEALAASSILKGRHHLSTVVSMLHTSAEDKAEELSGELFAFLDDDYYFERDLEMFWNHFHLKLKDLKVASVCFRKMCLFRQREDDECTLFHEVCKLNPPPEVVKTLLDITPVNENTDRLTLSEIDLPSEFNHLACTSHESGREYPLHMVMRHGGSIELVKLLINADTEKKTLERTSYAEVYSSLFHVLIANKEEHQSYDFSEILRHLALSASIWRSALLFEGKTEKKTPLGLMWEMLENSGMSIEDILGNDDFVFILRATCSHFSLRKKMSVRGGVTGLTIEELDSMGYDERLRDIEQIPLPRALLVCSPCFDRGVLEKMFFHLFSTETNYLLEKDSNGKYPFHQMIKGYYSEEYFFCPSCAHVIKDCVIKMILRMAPQCAKQIDDEGRLPLHIAADTEATRLGDTTRVCLVRTIWRAHPDAAGVVDKVTGLPPFALSTRARSKIGMFDGDGSTLSSAFFLLRSHPEILSEYIVGGEKIPTAVLPASGNSEGASPPTKRHKPLQQKSLI